MREIKFRAWDNTEKKMLSTTESWNKIWWDSDAKEGEDDYNYHSKQLFIDNHGHILEFTDEHGICDMHFLLRGKPKYELMQYTGLQDKNGKEIYEGDLLKHDLWGISQVIWEHGMFRGTGNNHDITLADHQLMRSRVIGNIYENPELAPQQEGKNGK